MHVKFYCIYDNDDSDLPSHLIDMNGNRIIEDPQRIFYNAAGNVFVTEDADADKITMDYDGNVVDDATSSCYFWYAGYGTISRDDTEDIKVVTPDSILEGLSAYSEGELLFTKDDKIADLRTGDVLGAGYTADDVGETFCPGLVSIYDPSSDRYSDPKVSLYDVLSGEELLPNEYQEIESAGDYIYARPIGADTWEVYKINIVSDAA